jgi:hypothetical protein
MGYCAGYDTPGTFNRGGFGLRGAGFGMGRGRGFRNRFFASGMPFGNVEPNPDWELTSLKAQAEALKNELQEIENRLNSLNQNQKESEV